MAMRNEVNARLIAAIGLIGTIVLVVLTIAVDAGFTAAENREAERRVDLPSVLGSPKEQQLARISRYGWIDRNSQIVSIPIDQAMQMFVAGGGRMPTTQPGK